MGGEIAPVSGRLMTNEDLAILLSRAEFGFQAHDTSALFTDSSCGPPLATHSTMTDTRAYT